MAEPAHIRRLKGTVRVLQQIVQANDDGSGMARMSFFMATLTDELASELAELDEFQVRAYMYQIGEVISWIGHGDNSRLPEMVREFAEQIVPTVKEDDSDTNEGSSTYLSIDSATG